MDSEQGGLSEAYRAPAADYDLVATPAQSGAGYIVSSTKLAGLYLATFGLYGVYWLYSTGSTSSCDTEAAVGLSRAPFSPSST